MGIITKSDENRWFVVEKSRNIIQKLFLTGESKIVLFGNAGPQNVTQLVTGQPELTSYYTEEALESKVNSIAGDSNYYKEQAETEGDKFQGPSGLYPPIEIDLNEDING